MTSPIPEFESTGWIGDDPGGRQAVFILFLPRGSSAAAANGMLAFAARLRLREGTATALGPDTLSARLTGRRVVFAAAGSRVVHEQPIPDEWTSIARSYGKVVLVVSVKPLNGTITPGSVDAHVRGPGPHFVALVPVRPETGAQPDTGQ